jgi:hypothetical protein
VSSSVLDLRLVCLQRANAVLGSRVLTVAASLPVQGPACEGVVKQLVRTGPFGAHCARNIGGSAFQHGR